MVVKQTDENESTMIRVKVSTWKKLKDLQTQPSDTFDSVINQLLEEVEPL